MREEVRMVRADKQLMQSFPPPCEEAMARHDTMQWTPPDDMQDLMTQNRENSMEYDEWDNY